MIIHNRDIYNSEEYNGTGLIDTVLSLVNGVIQHKDAIKDVVTVAKDVINIGKDVKGMVEAKEKAKNPLSIEAEDEVPEDVKNIIKKIKSLSEGRGDAGGGALSSVPGEFRYV